MEEKEVRGLINEALEKALPKKMTDEEKMQNARDFRDISRANKQYAEQRSEDVAGEFARLEVQIATILLAFTGFFVSSFTGDGKLDVFWAKLAISIAIASLIFSLVMGLLQLKRVEHFWDEFLSQRLLRFLEWLKVTEKLTTFEEAKAFHRGTALDKGIVVYAPRWPWILQTVFLGSAVIILFVLFLVFLFGN